MLVTFAKGEDEILCGDVLYIAAPVFQVIDGEATLHGVDVVRCVDGLARQELNNALWFAMDAKTESRMVELAEEVAESVEAECRDRRWDDRFNLMRESA